MAGNRDLPYQWKVIKVKEELLERTLDDLEGGWEVFSVLPTIYFGKKFMGAPVPSEVLYAVVLRRETAG